MRNAGAHPKDVSLKRIRGATRCLINARRKNHGLGRLRENRDLATAAKRHSRDMVEDKFFSHSSLSGATPLDRVLRTSYLSDSSSYAIGKNIAWGSRWKAKPRAIIKAWMRSSGHRAVILNSTYRHVGIGVARGAPKRGVRRAATYTANFGRRQPPTVRDLGGAPAITSPPWPRSSRCGRSAMTRGRWARSMR